MSYKITHALHFLRKHILRKESQPGNFRRFIGAGILAWLILFSNDFLLNHSDEIYLLKSLFSLRGSIEAPEDLALIAIDDVSYRKLSLSQKKAFPRDVFAKAIRSIQRDKPKFVILDFLAVTDEEDEVGTALFIEALSMGAASIGSAPVLVDDAVEMFVSDPRISAAAQYELPMAMGVVGEYALNLGRNLKNHQKPLEHESVPLLRPLRDLVSPDLKTPTPRALINYFGAESTIRTFSLWELFEDRVIPNGFFKDKIVLVGFKSVLQGRGFSDKEVLKVPVRSKQTGNYEMYGVEIFANIAGNLLNENWIRRLPIPHERCFTFILLFFLVKGLIEFHALAKVWFAVSFVGVWFLGTYVAFTYFNVFIPGVMLAALYSPLILGSAFVIYGALAMKELKELKRVLDISS